MYTQGFGADERGGIVEAGFACVAEPHDGPVPVAAILARAGVSSRAFYRHFESKDDLFVAMLDVVTDVLAGRLDDIAGRLDDIAGSGQGGPVDLLRAWITQMFAIVCETELHRYLAVVDCDELRSAKGYRQARERSRARRESSLSAILRAGRADGSFPLAEPEGDAIAIAALVNRELTSLRIYDPAQLGLAQARVEGFALRALGVAGIG